MAKFTIYNPETNLVYKSGDAPDPMVYDGEYPGAVIKIGVDTGDPGMFMYDPVNECAKRIPGDDENAR